MKIFAFLSLTLVDFILATLLFLFAAALLPVLTGHTPYPVVSGSMLPAIHPGDVIIVDDTPTPEKLTSGHVITVQDPNSGDPLTHRIVESTPDGFITKGDANPTVDAQPATIVIGTPVSLVPFIGAPALWRSQGQILPFLLAAAGAGSLLFADQLLRKKVKLSL